MFEEQKTLNANIHHYSSVDAKLLSRVRSFFSIMQDSAQLRRSRWSCGLRGYGGCVGKITNERCSVSDIFRKQIFDAIKVLRRDKKKCPDGKTIHSYITQHNATSLDENFLLNAIKLLLEENPLKNIPTREKIGTVMGTVY